MTNSTTAIVATVLLLESAENERLSDFSLGNVTRTVRIAALSYV